MAASQLEVLFVSRERTVWSGSAHQVVAPAVDGSLGVLPGMQPTLTVLSPGAVRILGSGEGQDREMRITGGFMSVDENVVTLVVDDVEFSSK